MGIRFLKGRRIEDIETEAGKLLEQGYLPLEGGFLEETNPDTAEKFILLMVKRPAASTPAPALPVTIVTPITLAAPPEPPPGEETTVRKSPSKKKKKAKARGVKK